MKKSVFIVFTLAMPLISGCGEASISSSGSLGRIIINNYDVYVEERLPIDVIFTGAEEAVTYTYSGHDIRIDDGIVRGLLADTSTVVTAETPSGISTTFTVDVTGAPYAATNSFEASEGWLNATSVDVIPGLADDFPLGIDISMTRQIYDMGGQFYNEQGVPESLYQILKDHGVNYVRLRLWNDPYNHLSDGTLVPYGGGICDEATVLDMAQGAKDAGLKFLLDFHLSDFWADPGNQIIPKDWQNYETSAEVASAMHDYIYQVLSDFEAAGALPDMVQIGNETTPGLFTAAPGGTNETLTGDSPYYTSQKHSISSMVAGPNGSANLHQYMAAGLAAVHDVDPDILTMIHIAKGMTGTTFINNYFHQFDDLDYDIIGLSGYSYYQFSTGFSAFRSGLSAVSAEFPEKKITIAETAYGFTYAADANAGNVFSRSGGQALSGYDVTPQGQANFVRDVIAAVQAIPNGYGVFYWEGAWIPVAGAGWADANSKCSWANQAFFTYDGFPLPSLSLYEQIKG